MSAPVLVVVATEAERPEGAGFEVLVTGVGKAAAAVATAERLLRGAPVAAVVSFGVAGAYPGCGLGVGDVVVASEVAVVDEGLERGERFEPFAKPAMEVPGAAWAPADAALVDRLVSGPPPTFTLVRGRVATVSVCAGSLRLAQERVLTGAVAESMEGAAVALAAARCGAPAFAEVRGISNLCGPRDGARFELALAVRHAAEVLARLGRTS